MKKCLYCYRSLSDDEKDFHSHCSKKFFGTEIPPEIDFGLSEISELAIKVLDRSVALTGVQSKLSLDILKDKTRADRFTIVGLWGGYILKPPVERFPEMPEIEDLTMLLAELVAIRTAKHSLIRLKSGELAYISKRFDRLKSTKLHLEDMAQITEMLTERKYSGSMEKVGKAILKYSDYAGNDAIRFFDLTLFCFITGNADMHLKNFSLIKNTDKEIMLSPAYDLLSTKILMPEDKEELALTLNGKKNNLRKKDFDLFAEKLGVTQKTKEVKINKYFSSQQTLNNAIDDSFLKDDTKNLYKELIAQRLDRLK
jgi:serine/threonine-protein kinase HipA